MKTGAECCGFLPELFAVVFGQVAVATDRAIKIVVARQAASQTGHTKRTA